ncbi:MAG: RNA polymerase sigma factor [Acidobacteriota bacterium]
MSLSLVIRDAGMAGSRKLDDALPAMNEEDFHRFYERTARPLWSYLARITGEPQRADDLLQEAYYRFYRAGARHQSEAHRRNSLFQIATNIVRDAARRGKHYAEVALEEESTPDSLPESPAPSAELQAAARTDLARAMQQLEPVQREMLWLAYAQGATHDEIADIVGMRAVSVRTVLLRARRKLATILTSSGPVKR